MKRDFKKYIVFLAVNFIFSFCVFAQNTATIKINSNVTFQKITGFGGFVNSPQFAYNHMTTTEISKLWGPASDMGYNIMRIYIPIGESNWNQTLATAQYAKSLGLILFASPWSMPANWKTNNNIAAVYTDGNGVKQIGYLKEENYEDYANYLNNYVTYLRNNGVELDAISIQNEPDWEATYAGCIWTPAQMAKFIKNYAHLINCKVIAPESTGLTDEFANALVVDSVFNQFDIYGGHQYGAIQKDYKKFQEKGMEVWMTEFLINWNEIENTTRNFNWSVDAFTFANKLNVAMLSNINAWIHYAAKRYYAMMGDGLNGTTSGVITKRGYILSHFSKYTIGSTRIENKWIDDTNILQGSSYLSVTGDSVIVMVINPSNNPYNLTVDLPFYTTTGKSVTTTASLNMSASSIDIAEETCRPRVDISASSFTTLIFVKSKDRPVSQMIGEEVHLNLIDNLTPTNAAFGTNYKMSGKTFVFDNSRPLISANRNANNGYLVLNDRYNKIVFRIETISSTMNYTSANTTLYYINNSGAVRSYNYGTVNFAQGGNYDWVLDISEKVLTDGCKGILGISNGNFSSVLTIKFGDVYFKIGNEKMYKFTGIYSGSDGNLLDCLESPYYTSLDFTGTTGISSDENWSANAANSNCIFYTAADVSNNNINVVTGNVCDRLTLSGTGGDFFVPVGFTATAASYSRTFDGFGMLLLPFEAIIPEGAKAYTLQYQSNQINGTLITNNIIPANTPVLISGTGTFTFTGTGSVSTPRALRVNEMNGVYISIKAPANSFYLTSTLGVASFSKVVAGSEPTIAPFSAYFAPASVVSATNLPLILDDETSINQIKNNKKVDFKNSVIYDLYGRKVYKPLKGTLYIINGEKVIFN